MIDEMDIKIGALLRKERIERGISQEQLGESIGVSFQQVQKYERGINRVSLSSLIPMLRSMNVNPQKFIERVSSGEAVEVITPDDRLDTKHVRDFLKFPATVRGKMVAYMNSVYADMEAA